MTSLRTIFIVTAAFLTAASVGWAAEAWTELPALPEGLAGFAVRNHGGNVQIAGGTTWIGGRKIWSDRIMEFDESGGMWRKVGNLPYPLAYGGYMADEEYWWLLGGHNSRESSRDILCLNDAGEVMRRAGLPSRWRFARGTTVASDGYFAVRQEAPDEGWEGAFLSRLPPKSRAKGARNFI